MRRRGYRSAGACPERIEKARLSRSPRELARGDYTVVLELNNRIGNRVSVRTTEVTRF
ncbi:MAG: hypothetical protein ACR2NN_06285 [Bryobacteraceae bacterium]